MEKRYGLYQEGELPWVNSIPSHWKWLRNGAFLNNHLEKVGDEFSKYQLLSLTTTGVKEKNINAVNGKVPESYEGYQKVYQGDIVFCLFDLDCSAVFSGLSDYDGMITSAYDVVRPKGEIVNPRFLKYWYDYGFTGRYYKIFSKSVRYTINYDSFKTIKTPVPPKPEQDQIVRYLDWKTSEIDRFIHQKKKQIKRLEELRQAKIDEITLHGIRPCEFKNMGFDWLGDIPVHWNLTRLRNNYKLQNGISESGAFFDKGTPFVNYGDVYNNRILPTEFNDVANSDANQQKIFSVKKGDIFFTRTSETIDDIGIASVCLEDVPKAVFSGFLIRARSFSDMLMPEYMGLYLQTNCVRNYFTKEMNLVIRASLGQNLLKSLYIPVPPRNEQEDIVHHLKTLLGDYDRMINNIKKEISLLQELRTKIIADVVTGQIDVRDEIIPEYDKTEENEPDDELENEDDSEEESDEEA